MSTIPDTCAQRPVFKGMVVPFFAHVNADGTPDFKVIDPKAIDACVNRRLCGICGGKLRKRVWFIGGEKSVRALTFVDPPMHEECARYAASVCPFLLGNKSHAENVVQTRDGTLLGRDPKVEKGLPRTANFVSTVKYFASRQNGWTYFIITGPARIETFWRNPAYLDVKIV